MLRDCEAALDELAHCGQSEWRLRWITIVVLLRVVGHVLNKVDGPSNCRMGLAVEKRWQQISSTKPEPSIFWNFIEDERNSILKEYRFMPTRYASGSGVTSISTSTADGKVATATSDKPGEIELHVFYDGPFTGRPLIEVAAEAIAWWKAYLGVVDDLAKQI